MLVNHMILHSGYQPLPVDNFLYEYLFASNGVFVHAKRKDMEVMIPVMAYETNLVRGLEKIEPYVHLPKLIAVEHLQAILRVSRKAIPNEALFYCIFANGNWRTVMPAQDASHAAVKPKDGFNTLAVEAVIEIHSHNYMDAFFSSQDNADETGLKLFIVLGQLDNDRVQIRARVGVYGHFYEIPANWIFEEMIEVDDVSEF